MVGVGNIISVGGSGGGGSSSGIQQINGQTGPNVTLVGTSGIVVAPAAPNTINIGFGGSVTATKYADSFTNITSGIFSHGLNSMDVVVQVRDAETGGAQLIIPDRIIIENLDQVSVLFNRPQTGRIVII